MDPLDPTEGRPIDDPGLHEGRYRSGAVARMLRMPVATLRVWERRYRVSQPQLSPSGQRLYSALQVQRLAQLKQLTDLGHAIGSLARLELPQLQQVLATHARTLAQTRPDDDPRASLSPPSLPELLRASGGGRPGLDARSADDAPAPRARAETRTLNRHDAGAGAPDHGEPDPGDARRASPTDRPSTPARAAPKAKAAAADSGAPSPPWRLLIVGKLLGQRLKGPVQQALTPPGRTLHLLGPFETLDEAIAQPLASATDAVLVYAASLQDDWLDQLLARAPAWAGRPMAVLYGFASERTCRLLSRTPGMTLLRGPQSDTALAQWLRGWREQLASSAASAASSPLASPSSLPVPPRRWDDAALASFASLSTAIACECPKHLADLLMMLTHFEAYSAECEHRSPEDAELHAYLRQVTGLSRAQFETALERVARHEGLMPAG